MTDRLGELKRGVNGGGVSGGDGNTGGGGGSTTTNQLHTTGQEGFMKRFFDDVEIIKDHITQISNATDSLRDIHAEAMVATTSEKEDAITLQVTPIITDSNRRAQLAKTFLQKLSEENDYLKQQTSSSTSSVTANELRIRTNLVNTLTRKFVDVMKLYQATQQKFKTDLKKKLKRQIKTFNPAASDEDVDLLVNSGGGSSEILKNSILKGGSSEYIQNAVRGVDEKYREVAALEASCAQLHEMFVDFAQLVEQQGELLDQIDYQIKQAGDFLDEANVDMQQAVNYAIELRKRQCCLAVILLVVIGVIIGIVFAFKEQNS